LPPQARTRERRESAALTTGLSATSANILLAERLE
jgi:hypothetical protein